jgi:hypothetical protein
MATISISSRHCRAICDEVGERLQFQLDRTMKSPPQKIMDLLRELELQEQYTPSIVPSLEDMEALVSNFAVGCGRWITSTT